MPRKKSGNPLRLINPVSMARSVFEPRRHPDSIPSTIPSSVESTREVPTNSRVQGRLPRITLDTDAL